MDDINKISSIGYEIALYNSPYFELLVSEFYRISRYKSNIYKKIKSEEDFYKKLSPEERTILITLNTKEKEILEEIFSKKNFALLKNLNE